MPIDDGTLLVILDGLVSALGTVESLRVHDYEPSDLDSLPAVTVTLAEGERSGVSLEEERRESAIGRVDLYTAWTVRLWVKADYNRETERDALGLLGLVVGAIDADETLGGAVLSSSCSSFARERVVTASEQEFVNYIATVAATSQHSNQ